MPIFTWTGIYVGAQVGYAWGTSNINVTDGFGDFVSFHSSNSGVIGGGHVGYNLQFNQFVVGLEGDVDGTSLSKSISGSPFIEDLGSVPVTATAQVDIMGSIRGRVGYAWDRVLIYATGGVEFAGIKGTIYGPFGGQVSSSTTRVGWTLGGGLEYAITDNWSVRAEYRYAQFGHSSFAADNAFTTPGLAALGVIASRTTNLNRVEVGVSYKFDTAGPRRQSLPSTKKQNVNFRGEKQKARRMVRRAFLMREAPSNRRNLGGPPVPRPRIYPLFSSGLSDWRPVATAWFFLRAGPRFCFMANFYLGEWGSRWGKLSEKEASVLARSSSVAAAVFSATVARSLWHVSPLAIMYTSKGLRFRL